MSWPVGVRVRYLSGPVMRSGRCVTLRSVPAMVRVGRGVGPARDVPTSGVSVRRGHIRRYRDWRNANRPKATNPSATAVSRNLPNGCARIVRSAPSSPCVFCGSKVSAA